jgi:SAM-dependent methyltransferase
MNAAATAGLLGDTSERDYGGKLRHFNSFAAPELRRAIAGLGLRAGMRVLDAGCGTGDALRWLLEEVQPGGEVVGIDLSNAHVAAARALHSGAAITVLQADLLTAPLEPHSFDLVWCVNVLHHLRDPVTAVRAMTQLLRPGGRIAVGQSSLVPDMYFAWDARLERLTNEAVRGYYRKRYNVDERELASVRAVLGAIRRGGLDDVAVNTVMIERVTPLSAADEDYLLETLFRGTWGERLRPYLSADDYHELERLCNPRNPAFALRRDDFHFLQSFTLCVGRVR